jgi:hypothetical protein
MLRAFGNFVVIWYIFSALVYCTKKNLATLFCVYETFLKKACLEKMSEAATFASDMSS